MAAKKVTKKSANKKQAKAKGTLAVAAKLSQLAAVERVLADAGPP